MKSIEKTSGGVKVTINGEATGGKDEVKEFEMALVAVGRRPVTDGLGLEAAGLKTDDKGFIAVDARRKTAVDGIYAIGDITGAPMLAHKAMKEGVVAAEAISGDKSPRSIPSRFRTAFTPIPKSQPSASPKNKRRRPATRSRSESSRSSRAAGRAR